MTIKLPPKTPGDRLDYPIDFANLLASGESIVSTTSVVEAGLTEESVAGLPPFSGSIVTPVFSGGVEGETYRITITVTTDAGTPARIFSRDFCLTVEE